MRGRIQLAALVSGIVVPPQPDPDVTQARCSITDCSATPASRLALTMTSAHLVLHSISFAARCSRFARGYRCCEPLTHSHRTLPLYATLASAFTAHRHRQSTKSPQNGCLPRFCLKIFDTRVKNSKAVLSSVGETETACRIRSRTSASSPHNAKIALHIALLMKASL